MESLATLRAIIGSDSVTDAQLRSLLRAANGDIQSALNAFLDGGAPAGVTQTPAHPTGAASRQLAREAMPSRAVWACPLCDRRNPMDEQVCGTCEAPRRAAPPPPPPPPPHGSELELLQVVVPPRVGPGMRFGVSAPSGGGVFEVVVPQGMRPGMTMQVQVPRFQTPW